jgi:hypothetical protein
LRSKVGRSFVVTVIKELFCFLFSIDEVTELREGGDVRGRP